MEHTWREHAVSPGSLKLLLPGEANAAAQGPHLEKMDEKKPFRQWRKPQTAGRDTEDSEKL